MQPHQDISISIRTDKEKYRSRLAELKRQVAALEGILSAMEKYEAEGLGFSTVQSFRATLPEIRFAGASETESHLHQLPVKITPAVLEVLRRDEGLRVAQIKERLLSRGFDPNTKKLYEKIYRVLARQIEAGTVIREGEEGASMYRLR